MKKLFLIVLAVCLVGCATSKPVDTVVVDDVDVNCSDVPEVWWGDKGDLQRFEEGKKLASCYDWYLKSQDLENE